MSEKDVQNRILCFLGEINLWAWQNQSTAAYDPRTKGFRRLNKYQKKGVADIIAVHNKIAIFIEVKSLTGKLSPEQRCFIEQAKQRGAIAFMARSVGDVWQEIAHIFTESELKSIMHIVRRWVQIEEFERG